MEKSKEKQIYSTIVREVGNEAKGFSEINMVIFFGKSAPDALKPSCYLIDVNQIIDTVMVGMKLVVDNTEYPITAVGKEVQRNLENLGHISVVFDGSNSAEMAGTMYVYGPIPDISAGSTIKIIE